ncbi:MAG: FecR family protein [Helicobacteraceae bacterium]
MKHLLFLFVFVSLSFSSIAKISLAVGDVKIFRGSIMLEAETNAEVELKDQVITKDGKAQIVFDDNTIITLGRNTNLNIEEYVNEAKTKKASFKVPFGGFKIITGAIGKANPEKFKIKTPTTTIGIRGTIVVGEIGLYEEKIGCTHGRIVVSSQMATFKPVDLTEGQMISFDPKASATPDKAEIKTGSFEILDSEASSGAKDSFAAKDLSSAESTKHQAGQAGDKNDGLLREETQKDPKPHWGFSNINPKYSKKISEKNVDAMNNAVSKRTVFDWTGKIRKNGKILDGFVKFRYSNDGSYANFYYLDGGKLYEKKVSFGYGKLNKDFFLKNSDESNQNSIKGSIFGDDQYSYLLGNIFSELGEFEVSASHNPHWAFGDASEDAMKLTANDVLDSLSNNLQASTPLVYEGRFLGKKGDNGISSNVLMKFYSSRVEANIGGDTFKLSSNGKLSNNMNLENTLGGKMLLNFHGKNGEYILGNTYDLQSDSHNKYNGELNLKQK